MSDSCKIYEMTETLAHPVLHNNTSEAIAALSEKELVQLSKDIVEFHSKNVPTGIQNLRQRKEFNSYPLCFNEHTVVMRDPLADSFSNPAYRTPNVDAIKSSLNSAISTLLEVEPLVKTGVITTCTFLCSSRIFS